MYSVKPIGLNTKDNDRDVPDGSLLESINMQWRDGAFKPIPERIISEINASGYKNIIFHKVGDENRINVLGFNEGSGGSIFLAFDLSGYLGGSAAGGNILEWFGTITDGVYSPKTITQIPFVRTPEMSFTILNGLIYFMGSGSTTTEQYYVKLEFDETTEAYNLFDMYAWKTLIPFYPLQGDIVISAPNKTYNVLSSCGVILYRFALVLKSGEVVMHSPIYASTIYGLNRSDDAIAKDDLIQNIHSAINLNLEFIDTDLFLDEISAINIYASVPHYVTKLTEASTATYAKQFPYIPDFDITAKKAEELFYLVKTIDIYTTSKILFKAGFIDSDVVFDFENNYFSVDVDTIAAGELMPVDNFSYHRVFGKIGSYSGRLDVVRPITVLSGGHQRALATGSTDSIEGYSILTEDGTQEKILSATDKNLNVGLLGSTISRGILSYPDNRAFAIGLYEPTELKVYFTKSRKNASHNLSCGFAYSMSYTFLTVNAITLVVDPADSAKLKAMVNYDCQFSYIGSFGGITDDLTLSIGKYSSENRIQFSQVGEFKVWPALNSYRVGEGKVMSIGTGSVNPSESQIISPLIIGTSDGIYTANLDPSGSVFIASITKTKHIPFISEEILEIDMNILFISDQGLMVFSDGDTDNLTEKFFPQQGDGDYPPRNNIFTDYDTLTDDFFGEGGNVYLLDDIVKYMRGCLMAYDSRRRNIWCSNPAYGFSLVYNLDTRQWGMSTLVFDEKQELFSIINTDEGEIYTRYMVKKLGADNLLILSGEDLTSEVFYHVLTRPIKFQNIDDYKVLPRMISRTLLVRDSLDAYFSIGLWGQQEVNKYKKSIPLAIKKDSRVAVYPDDMRYHIPVDCRKGKYKSITVLQAGKTLPESYISSFDFDIYMVDNKKMR